jgi:cellulose synthase/poly-beta-1,6-N-acetylglucosamine synthase-like glycosyltransferase
MFTFNLIWHFALLGLLFDSFLRFVLLCVRVTRNAQIKLTGPESRAQRARGCVVLIAARNEAGVIGATVSSLKTHLGEWAGSSMWVIADRCTDDTALEAESAGAQVAVRAGGKLGKGAVIAWWLQRYEAVWQSREAIVILDADSRITEGSLSALRNGLSGGADAAQAFIAPDAHSSSGRLAGWSEVLMQRIDDEARRRCGWSVPLRGTGMIFRSKILAELAPHLHTFAEDMELDVLLAVRSARVEFVPAAVVYDPKPLQSAGASRQRARWIQGHLHVLRDYRREIMRALAWGGIGTWFLLWPLLLRPKILFIGLRILLLLISPWLALVGLTLDAIYYLAGAGIVDDPRRYLLDLLAVPRYGAMWFYGFGMALIRRGQKNWLRAGR